MSPETDVATPASTHAPAIDRADAVADAVRSLREVILAGERYRLAAATRLGLSITDSQAISYLFARGAMGQNDLALALEMSTGSITAMVDRLSASGFVERNPHPTDRRRTIVELSSAGSQALSEVRNWMDAVFTDVPTDELAPRAAMLREVAGGLRARTQRLPDKPATPADPAKQPRRRR